VTLARYAGTLNAGVPASGGTVPTYQYACTECDHRFDAVQAFSDPSLTVCPECGGKLRKVFSSVGIVFKGSGFYRTDSRAGAGSTVAKSEAGSDGSSSGSTPAEKKSETKADTKASAATKASTPAAAAS
jgi:putative FmdB family regulatory protein